MHSLNTLNLLLKFMISYMLCPKVDLSNFYRRTVSVNLVILERGLTVLIIYIVFIIATILLFDLCIYILWGHTELKHSMGYVGLG